MKTPILALLILSACQAATTAPSTPDPTSNSNQTSTDPTQTPGTASPTVQSPVASSSAIAPVIVAPVTTQAASTQTSGPTVVSTQSYGGYSCSLMSDGNVWCSNGLKTTGAGFIGLAVSSTMACAYQDAAGAPPYEANFIGPPNSVVDANVYCWAHTDSTATYMNMKHTFTNWNSVGYTVGPYEIRVNGLDICIGADQFLTSSGAYQAANEICGTVINGSGGLQ